jgi:transcriptional regulator with XRE-family HTH domain
VAEVRSPTVRRRELGEQLRMLRNEQGLTVEQVAERLLCSPSKISRMETGQRNATLRDVRDLCVLYGITQQADRDRLMTLAREARQQGWWQSYDLSYKTYAGLEFEATAIDDFQSSVVPGLLQTPEYARAGHLGTFPVLGPDEIERQIEAKLTRQEILTRTERPPEFRTVLDEAVLHRLTGGPDVMKAQLGRLVEASRLPNVTIQVIPFAVGAHPGVESNFNILRLPAASGVVFVEGLSGSTYLERSEDLERYGQVFAILQGVALSPQDSIDLIAQMRS